MSDLFRPKRIIIAGSRHFTDQQYYFALCHLWQKTPFSSHNPQRIEIVSGGAKGMDSWGEMLAHNMGAGIKIFPANWGKYGKAAGHIRNKKMALYAHALLLVWDGESPGSRNMKKQAIKEALPLDEKIMS